MSANKVKRPAEFIINVSLSAGNDLQGYLEFVPSGETCRFSSVMDMMRLSCKPKWMSTEYLNPQRFSVPGKRRPARGNEEIRCSLMTAKNLNPEPIS